MIRFISAVRATGLLNICNPKRCPRFISTTYCRMSTAASFSSQPQVAIIGGGIAGLSAASRLAHLGIPCTVFDMGSRNLGGRAASRILQKEGLSFDHGCQFFAPVSPEFSEEVERWTAAGAATPWQGRFGALDPSTLVFSPSSDMQSDIKSDMKIGKDRKKNVLKQRETLPKENFCGILGSEGESGVSAPVQPYVGTPSTSAVANFLAQQLYEATDGKSKVHLGHKITSFTWNESTCQWTLSGTIPRSTASSSTLFTSTALEKKEGNCTSSPSLTSKEEESFGDFSAIILADALATIPDSAGYTGMLEKCPPKIAELAARIGIVQHEPVFSLMLAFETPLGTAIPFDGAWIPQQQPFTDNATDNINSNTAATAASMEVSSSFQWIARDSSKPGRPGNKSNASTNNVGGPCRECWVAITTAAKARDILNRWPLHSPAGAYNPQTQKYREGVAQELVDDFLDTLNKVARTAAAGKSTPPPGGKDVKLLNKSLPRVTYQHAQRWGRGFVSHPLPIEYLECKEHKFAACGDFCGGSLGERKIERKSPIEAAWSSGQRAAEAVAGWFSSTGSRL